MSTSTNTTRSRDLVLHARSRTPDGKPKEQAVRWDPRKTAIIVCDVWDAHWCRSASMRVGEMVAQLNRVVCEARRRGVLIVHAPSDTMAFYEGTQQRELARRAPFAPAPSDVTRWHALDPGKEGPLPIDDSDGGCDDVPQCAQPQGTNWPWARQHPAIEIAAEDTISDQGQEVYNLLREHGITNVIELGVHTNFCVLGRSFSIRSLVGAGLNVVLMRDLTDTMYNPRMRPQVSHFRGTELVVEHIETYWCPTVTSSDLTGEPPFRFRGATASPRE